MNAFWLLFTLMLWNVLCEVHGGPSGELTVGSCGENSLPGSRLLLNQTITLDFNDKTAFRHMDNAQITKLFKAPKDCINTCFEAKNLLGSGAFVGEMLDSHGGNGTTFQEIGIIFTTQTAKFSVKMYGTCKPTAVNTVPIAP